MLTVGSLFAGIGGFDLGFERAGMRTVWQVEREPFCQRVLARHFPDAARFDDVREVGAHNLDAVDLICGGFPCQDLSTAGAGAGLSGSRSGLWSEMFRVACELRPRYLVIENVAALLTGDDGAWMRRVLCDLASGGFDAEWDCLPASAFGAPHQRDRIWIVAYPAGEHGGQRRAGGPRSDGSHGKDVAAAPVADAHQERWYGRAGELGPLRGTEPANGGSRELQDADGSALQPWRVGGRAAQAGGPEWWSVEPPVGRVAHGVPNRLDQLAALGNALVPQIAEWIGHRILEWEGSVIA